MTSSMEKLEREVVNILSELMARAAKDRRVRRFHGFICIGETPIAAAGSLVRYCANAANEPDFRRAENGSVAGE